MRISISVNPIKSRGFKTAKISGKNNKKGEKRVDETDLFSAVYAAAYK